MHIEEYKASIKKLVDATNDEVLLKAWNEQLQRDIEHQQEQEYDEVYINSLRDKAKSWLGAIDSDQWLRQIRGNEE